MGEWNCLAVKLFILGVPLNKPGSAWHNKYIAIIEPPKAKITVRAPKWLLKGNILPMEKIERNFSDWLRKAREIRLARKSFEVLKGDIRTEKPILVKADTYSYYLIPFKDSRLAAIFNAYDGSFERTQVLPSISRNISLTWRRLTARCVRNFVHIKAK